MNLQKTIKIGVAAALVAGLATSASAGTQKDNYFGLKMSTMTHDTISIVDSNTIKSADNFDQKGITFGTIWKKDSGLTFGTGSDIYAVYEGFGMGLNFKLGYSPEAVKGLSIYGTGGYDFGLSGSEQTFSGTSVGLGVNYDINDDFAVSLDYRTMDLTAEWTDVGLEQKFEPSGLSVALSLKY